VNSNPSQSAVILQILTTLRGRWVSMLDLIHASGGRRVGKVDQEEHGV
jgi:hypothetical protein